MLFNDAAIVFNELELFVWCSRETALSHYGEWAVSSEGSLKSQTLTAVGNHALSLINGSKSPLPNDCPGDLDVNPVIRSVSRRLLSSLVNTGPVNRLDDMSASDTAAARQTLPTNRISEGALAGESVWSGPQEFALHRVVLDLVCLVFMSVNAAADDSDERHSPQEDELRANIIRAFAGTGTSAQVEQFFWPPFRKLGSAIQTPQHLQMVWERWWQGIQTDSVLLILDTTAEIAIDHEKWFAFCKGDVLIMPGLQEMLDHPALKQKLLVGFGRFAQ